jgi:hypothetical protein
VDTNDAAQTTGIYESPDGSHHFIKAGKPVPEDWKLREATPRLNARPEVVNAQEGASVDVDEKPKRSRGGKKTDPDAIETKVDTVPDDKTDANGDPIED